MDIQFLTLTRAQTVPVMESRKLIADCVKAFSPENRKCKNFSSPKRLLISAEQALRSADAAIIAVQVSAYHSFKKMLCAALHLELVQHPTLCEQLNPLCEQGKLSQTALQNNTTYPANAALFATGDYRCCGFAVTSGAQCVIVLPLDPIKTAETVFGSLYDFLADFADVPNRADVTRFKRAGLCARIVSLLKQQNATLAFVPPHGKAIMQAGMKLADSENRYLSFAEAPEQRARSQPAGEYIVAAAQKARVQSHTTYACMVSGAFASNRDDTVFVHYAVADADETVAAKLFANPGESPKAASAAAVEQALLLAGNKITQNLLAAHAMNNRTDRKFRRTLAIVSAAGVAGAAALSAVLALLLQ